MGDTGTHESSGERQALSDALPGYELAATLGRGSFAVVFAARHVRLGREVAIKRLSPELLRDSDARHRFAAEARLLASLDHPHVVRVYDYVEEGDVCALVMERLRGGTLADRLRVGPIPQARACAIVLAALHGLEHAHRHGVLHRDVKPENLLFGDSDLLKVADFGIAKVVGSAGARLTATAHMLGTPAFMAPEQVSRSAGPLSSATDVWSVGAVLYELLAGEPPFARDGDLAETLMQRVSEDPRPLRAVAPDVPAELDAVVMRALEREPGRRHPTAAAFASALEPAVERAYGAGSVAATGVPVHRTDPATGPEGDPSLPTLVESGGRDQIPLLAVGRPVRRRGRTVLVAGLAAVAAIAAAVVVALSGGGSSGQEERASLPALPPGWPKTMALGFKDRLDGPSGVRQRVGTNGLAVDLFDGDAAKPNDWSVDPKRSPADFARRAQAQGVLPLAVYYMLRAIGQFGHDDVVVPGMRRTLVDARLMRAYWVNVRKLMRSLGSTGRPAAIDVEPSVWPLFEQALGFEGQRPDSVRALVGTSGLPELQNLPDTLPGFARGWRTLRDRYAPKALLGYGLVDYGTNVDISRDLPARPTLLAAARQQGAFLIQSFPIFDFATFEIAYSEEGQNPTRLDLYSTAEKQGVADFVGQFVRVSGIPAVLTSVPFGNTVMKTISDKPFHWRDSWVQWLLGDDGFTGLRKLRDAGVIGVEFGAGFGSGNTCPCDAARDGITNDGKRGRVSRSPDDDGGYFAERAAALRKAGGLTLR